MRSLKCRTRSRTAAGRLGLTALIGFSLASPTARLCGAACRSSRNSARQVLAVEQRCATATLAATPAKSPRGLHTHVHYTCSALANRPSAELPVPFRLHGKQATTKLRRLSQAATAPTRSSCRGPNWVGRALSVPSAVSGAASVAGCPLARKGRADGLLCGCCCRPHIEGTAWPAASPIDAPASMASGRRRGLRIRPSRSFPLRLDSPHQPGVAFHEWPCITARRPLMRGPPRRRVRKGIRARAS